MRSGRPPTLWCDLIVTEGPPEKDTLSITSGVERSLRQKFRRAATIPRDLLRLRLEGRDEEAADDLALLLRVADAVQRGQKDFRRLHVHQRDVVVAAEQRDDLLALALPHQAVVDVDAGERVAERLVDQHRRHRRVDAAREAEQDAAVTHLGADRGDGFGAERLHRPVAAAVRDLEQEIPDEGRPLGRVVHLGVELQPVELARLVGDDADGRVLRLADRGEARRQCGSFRRSWNTC